MSSSDEIYEMQKQYEKWFKLQADMFDAAAHHKKTHEDIQKEYEEWLKLNSSVTDAAAYYHKKSITGRSYALDALSGTLVGHGPQAVVYAIWDSGNEDIVAGSITVNKDMRDHYVNAMIKAGALNLMNIHVILPISVLKKDGYMK